MQSIRRTLSLVAAIVALLVIVPTALAAPAKTFHLAKDCGATGCTVTSSSYHQIPAGSVITYTPNTDGSLTALITAPHGTSTGRCDLSGIANGTGPGRCQFNAGTGALHQFHLDVAVTTSDFVTWFWDGTYWHGNGCHHR